MLKVQPQKASQEYFAVLDLGTTTCRLLIAEPTPQGPQVVDSFVRVIRLGEGLATKGRLSPAAISRALATLTLCANKLKLYNVKHLRCVATAACREASNRDEFLEAVRLNTGLNFEVISTAEEAQLAIMGCSEVLDSSTRYAVGCDIGGGSTEIMWVKLSPDSLPQLIAHLSVPLGVVTLHEILGKHASSYSHLQDIRSKISSEAKLFSEKVGISPHFQKKDVQLIATSGTFTTLAALHLKLDRYNPKKVNGQRLSTAVIKSTIASLYEMNHEERLRHPCIGPLRADLVLGGVAIFEGIYDVFPVDPVRVATHGVREGLLRTLAMSAT